MIDPSVALPGYGASGPAAQPTNVNAPLTPMALAVDSTSWQYVKCPAAGVPGTQRATFTIPVKENGGASNVSWVEGMFSVGGADSDGSGGPTTDAGGCHFHWDNVGQALYLDVSPGASNWKTPPSPLGQSGFDLDNGVCTLHSATSSVSLGTYVLTLSLDVTLYSKPKYHIYTLAENRQGGFSNTQFWLYWGWWATQ